MGHNVCKIERLANGYEVSLADPKIVAQNEKGKGVWKDPEVCYVFKSTKEVLAFLKQHLDTALPLDEYEDTFSKASAEEEDE